MLAHVYPFLPISLTSHYQLIALLNPAIRQPAQQPTGCFSPSVRVFPPCLLRARQGRMEVGSVEPLNCKALMHVKLAWISALHLITEQRAILGKGRQLVNNPRAAWQLATRRSPVLLPPLSSSEVVSRNGMCIKGRGM